MLLRSYRNLFASLLLIVTGLVLTTLLALRMSRNRRWARRRGTPCLEPDP